MTPARAGAAAGVAGMTLAGAGVTVAGFLSDAPDLTAQALRYALAAAALGWLARVRGVRLARPRGREWLWLAALAAIGMAAINVVLVQGSTYADPSVFGVALGGVPTVLALVGPLARGRRPDPRAVVACVVLTAGTVLIVGGGRTTATGVVLAAVVLACEAAFTLLAVPVLARLGPWSVSCHGSLLAAGLLLAAGALRESPGAALALSRTELVAVGFLAVGATAAAFVLWFGSVRALGADRAAPAIGAMPLAATLTAWLTGRESPSWPVAAGLALAVLAMTVAAGTRRRQAGTSRPVAGSTNRRAASTTAATNALVAGGSGGSP